MEIPTKKNHRYRSDWFRKGRLAGWIGVGLVALSQAIAQGQSVNVGTGAFVTNGVFYDHPASGSVQGVIETPNNYSHSFVLPASYVATESSSPVASSTQVVSNVSRQSSWLSAILNTQSSLTPQTLPSIERERTELKYAMTELENFLKLNPGEQANWLRYLKWNALQKELAKEDPDLLTLIQFEKNLRHNFNGLELRPFTKVRERLRRLTNTLRVSSDPKISIDYLNDRLKKLYESVKTNDLAHDLDSRREAAQTIEYLSQANQGSSLVSQLQSSFSRANVRVLLSNDFVQRQFSRPVSEYNPVREVILGTRITGDSVIQGAVRPVLKNNPRQATIQLNLHGAFSSNNVGFNRGVQINTVGSANVVACETISLGDNGLQTLADTGVDANLSTQITSIRHRSRLITRIARRKAAQQKPQADAIAEGRMENRIREQFHSQLEQQIAESNRKLASTDLRILDRLGIKKPTRTSWTSEQYVSLLWRVQDGVQLAATESCPIDVVPSGVTVQVHESAVGNALDPLFGGRIIRSEDLAMYAAQFGELGKAIRATDDKPWGITLDTFYPVELKFEDSLVSIRLRLTRLERDEQSLKQSALIQASYRPVITGGYLQLKREGDVKIEFSGRQDRGVKAVSLRSFLKTKLNEVFKEELLPKPFRISDRLPPEFQKINLVSITSKGGWLQAHLN